MFRKAVSIPAFSRANDISRDDVLEMVFSLRIDDALAQLRRAYPTSFPQIGDFAVDAPSDYPDDESDGSQQIRRDYLDPLAQANRLSLQISRSEERHVGQRGVSTC